MTKQEFETRIKSEKLTIVYDRGKGKKYIDSDAVVKNGIWFNNRPNVFGCYKGTSSYVIFMTDDERGIAYWGNTFDTEDEAYDALYKYIKLLDKYIKKITE